jgi:hypothetical protein
MFTHPETAKALVAQHHDRLVRDTAEARRGGRRRLPRWHVNWTRTVLVPAASAGASGPVCRRGSSLVIIISAHRST